MCAQPRHSSPSVRSRDSSRSRSRWARTQHLLGDAALVAGGPEDLPLGVDHLAPQPTVRRGGRLPPVRAAQPFPGGVGARSTSVLPQPVDDRCRRAVGRGPPAAPAPPGSPFCCTAASARTSSFGSSGGQLQPPGEHRQRGALQTAASPRSPRTRARRTGRAGTSTSPGPVPSAAGPARRRASPRRACRPRRSPSAPGSAACGSRGADPGIQPGQVGRREHPQEPGQHHGAEDRGGDPDDRADGVPGRPTMSRSCRPTSRKTRPFEQEL